MYDAETVVHVSATSELLARSGPCTVVARRSGRATTRCARRCGGLDRSFGGPRTVPSRPRIATRTNTVQHLDEQISSPDRPRIVPPDKGFWTTGGRPSIAFFDRPTFVRRSIQERPEAEMRTFAGHRGDDWADNPIASRRTESTPQMLIADWLAMSQMMS